MPRSCAVFGRAARHAPLALRRPPANFSILSLAFAFGKRDCCLSLRRWCNVGVAILQLNGGWTLHWKSSCVRYRSNSRYIQWYLILLLAFHTNWAKYALTLVVVVVDLNRILWVHTFFLCLFTTTRGKQSAIN